jgi:hypothetical protein
MSEPPESRANLLSVQIKVVAAVGFFGLFLVTLGLITDPLEFDGHPIAWFERLPLLFSSFTADGWFIGKHEGPLTVAGAVLLRLVVLSTIILAGWAIFARRIEAFTLAHRRGHVVVIGNTSAALEVVAHLVASKQKVTQVVEPDPSATEQKSRFQIVAPFAVDVLADLAAMGNAKRIVIDTGVITGNMALACALRHKFGEKAPPISCNIESAQLADEFGELLGIQNDVLIYDEARLRICDTLARYPLYASADKQGAERVHLLIIGFARFAGVFLEEAVQDSIAGSLEMPCITIIARDARSLAAGFARDKPAYGLACDVDFVVCDTLEALLDDGKTVDEAGSLSRAALMARDAAAPVTAILLCLSSDADNLAAALVLRAVRRRSGRFFAPTFVHMYAPGGSGDVFLHADKDGIVDPFDAIIPVRLSREALAIEILAEGERDEIARRIHANFRALAGDQQRANTSWAALSETFRRADRHAADHIAAKLWSLGLATERHSTESAFAVDADWERRAALDPSDLDRLARLEHRRWIADRVLEGWAFSSQRDDDLRLHPDLVPFDAVTRQDQEKDRGQVMALRNVVKEAARRDGHRFMPELIIALAAAPDMDSAAIHAARDEILRLILAPLGDLAAHHVITIASSLAPGGEILAVDRLASGLKRRMRQMNVAFGNRAVDLRLLGVEGVPYAVRLRQAFNKSQMREQDMHHAFQARRAVFRHFTRVEAVRIGGRGYSNDAIFRNPALFDGGLRREAAYLARRADLLCVLSRAGETDGPALDQIVAFWSGERAIPPDVDPGPSRNGAARLSSGMQRLIRIEI